MTPSVLDRSGSGVPAWTAIVAVVSLLAVPSLGLARPDGPPGVAAPIGAWEQTAKITPDDANEAGPYGTSSHAFVNFGSSLAVDEGTMAIGTPFDSHDAPQWVYMFERDNQAGWAQAAKLTAPNRSGLEDFGGFGSSVDVDGTVGRLVVGNPGWDRDGWTDVGKAYIYERTGSGAWHLDAELEAPEDFQKRSRFGFSVATDGELVAVGSPGTSSVHIYERSQAGWEKVTRFEEPTSFLGFTVDVAADTVVSGAVKESTSAGPIDGAIHVYEAQGQAWSQTARLIPPKPEVGTYGEDFGGALAISEDGESIVTGAVWDDQVVPGVSVEPFHKTANFGSAFLYKRSGEGWTHVASFTNPDGGPLERFGQDVGIASDGEAVVVGASDHPFASRNGAAYVYRPIAGEWRMTAQLQGNDTGYGDYFGHQVAFNGASVLVSSPFDDNRRDGAPFPFDDNGDLPYYGNDDGDDAGSVYAFHPRPSTAPGLVSFR